MPLAKRAANVLLAHVSSGDRVLEVGAGDRRMGKLLAETRRDIVYASQDPDTAGEHEFRNLSEVAADAAAQLYDCVFAFEVVEHLTQDEALPWFAELFRVTRPGGVLLLSTPNTFYPPDFLRDVTHRTPWCYDELAGAVAGAGFRPEKVLRIYNDPAAQYFTRRFALGWLFRLLRIDFARQIVVVARKPG